VKPFWSLLVGICDPPLGDFETQSIQSRNAQANSSTFYNVAKVSILISRKLPQLLFSNLIMPHWLHTFDLKSVRCPLEVQFNIAAGWSGGAYQNAIGRVSLRAVYSALQKFRFAGTAHSTSAAEVWLQSIPFCQLE